MSSAALISNRFKHIAALPTLVRILFCLRRPPEGEAYNRLYLLTRLHVYRNYLQQSHHRFASNPLRRPASTVTPTTPSSSIMLSLKSTSPRRRFAPLSARYHSKLLHRVFHLRRVEVLLLLTLHTIFCIFIGLRLQVNFGNFAIYDLSLPFTASLHNAASFNNPCHTRLSPPPIYSTAQRPPTLYFLHIPKTAGTLMYHLVLQYANRTDGLACQFLYDGNRFGIQDFQVDVKSAPPFSHNPLAARAVSAFREHDFNEKAQLYKQGACRAVRGHVTYAQRDQLEAPQISLTVVRHPIDRFVSMYEFVHMMVRDRPGKSGWDHWLNGRALDDEIANETSIMNRGFYDVLGRWIAEYNIGFSFHFYGVLHQLSGMTPKFEGVGDPQRFRIANAREMAEKAKDNICSTHILGSQSDVPHTLDTFFKALKPYAHWSDDEKKRWKGVVTNANVHKSNQNVRDYMSEAAYEMLEGRLKEEIEVFEFAERVIEYRKKFGKGDVFG